MTWDQAYSAEHQPDLLQMDSYIKTPLWSELCKFIEENYKALPRVEYSRCSMQRGWNVKYKKSNRAICTLYPAKGFYTCMVAIGAKEKDYAEASLPDCTTYVQELYANTAPFNGGRWLMIDVTSQEILEDVKELIRIRMEKKW